MDYIGIGLIGLGTVGKDLVNLLNENRCIIEKRDKISIKIVQILVTDVKKKRSNLDAFTKSIITDNQSEFFNNEKINIVVELMGGLTTAYDYIIKAINLNKHVVTANKDLIASKGVELLKLAKSKKVALEFEASVCGGIPIINMLKTSYAGNKIKMMYGILNGTTNYILTLMESNDLSFEEALIKAQNEGYAEKNPTNDINGLDATSKIAILASIAFNTKVPMESIKYEGIKGISREDILYAKELGYRIKLLGIAKDLEDFIKIQVNPVLIPKSHPLANIEGVYNAVYLEGNGFDKAMIYGLGAGGLATASSVLGDIINIAREKDYNNFIWSNSYRNIKINDSKEIYSNYYIRMHIKDITGALSIITGIFGNHEVGIFSVNQKRQLGDSLEVVIVTHKVNEINMDNALILVNDSKATTKICSVIKVEDNI